MKVLVTGASGFVGREISRQLHGAGHEVRALTRAEAAGGVAICAEAMSGAGAIIHLVGIISECGDQTFENVHARLTQTLISAAQRANVRRFIHMSALGTRADAVARYHQTKWAAEEIVRASGLDWTIFRPSIIYGAGDGLVNLFARIARVSPLVPLIGGGVTRFQPITVENVAHCFVKAVTESNAISRTFDLGGPEILSLKEIVEGILVALEKRRFKLPVPFPLAHLQATIAELVFCKILSRPPPLNRDQVLMLREDNVGNGSAADELFQLRHESFRAGISHYLRPSKT